MVERSSRKAADFAGLLYRQLTLGRLAGTLVLAGFVALRFWDPAALETLRLKTFDLYQLAHPRTPDQQPVVIIDIDEKSLGQLGQWPWPRTLIAELVTRLTDLGAAAIGFDMVFSERDRLSPPLFADTARGLDADTKVRLKALPENELVLAAAIRNSNVVLGQAGHNEPVGSATAAGARTPFATIGGDPREFLVSFPGLIRNVGSLEEAAAGRGLFTVRPERDGITRRVPAVLSAENQLVASLAIELLRVGTGTPTLLLKRDEAGLSSLVVAGVEIPTDQSGQIWINFAPHDRVRFVPAVDVLRGAVPKERIEGKLILVGTSAVGLFDLRSTPVDRSVPGVEIHAQVIENIVSQALIRRPNYALGAEIVLAVVVAMAIIILVPMLGALPVIALGVTIGGALLIASWQLYRQHLVFIDVVYPLASSFAVFFVLAFVNYYREERQRAQIRSAFGQYLAPALVEQLAAHPEKLVLGGEAREITVLFSDVRGFTSIAETYRDNPSGLTILMNRLLTPLSNSIIERRGTIDKYMGDAIMAFWNAPLDDADHGRNGCEAALDMIARLDALNAKRQAEADRLNQPFQLMEIGIGLSTGVSVVGNMGSDIRFDYSALGDPVNVASRLQALTATYGLRVLLASDTALTGAAHLACLEIDTTLVRGRTEPVRLFGLLGGSETAQDPSFLALRAAISDLLGQIGANQWATALQGLQKCRALDPLGQLTKLLEMYSARIEAGLRSQLPV